MQLFYWVANVFFFIFHSGLIIFNLFGWLWRKTRLINLIVIILTLSSWFVLGLWYGYGYCPFTDWHWQVREKLGYYDHPPSYTAFLIETFTGWTLPDDLINRLTLGCLLAAFLASIFFNSRDLIQKKRKGNS